MMFTGIDQQSWRMTNPDKPTPLAQSLRLAALAWGARRAWFLTNGASSGNHIATMVARALGREAIVQRSVHSSVIDGIAHSGIDTHFLQPTVDTNLGSAHGVTVDQVAEALRTHPNSSSVYLTSPSYFGAVSDIAAIADVVHAHGIPLIVDEAWGAHFGFHPRPARQRRPLRRRPGDLQHAQRRRFPHPVGDAASGPRPRSPDGSRASSTGSTVRSSRPAAARCCWPRWTRRGATSPSTARRQSPRRCGAPRPPSGHARGWPVPRRHPGYPHQRRHHRPRPVQGGHRHPARRPGRRRGPPPPDPRPRRGRRTPHPVGHRPAPRGHLADRRRPVPHRPACTTRGARKPQHTRTAAAGRRTADERARRVPREK